MITNFKFNNKMLKCLLTSVLLINVCYATPPNCLELHQSQLASLNERMNQMINALQSSPILSKLISTSNLSKASSVTPCDVEEAPPHQTPQYPSSLAYAAPSPNVVYVSPPALPPAATMVPHAPLASPFPTVPTLYYPHASPSVQPLEYSYRSIPSPAPSPVWSHYYDSYPYYVPPHAPPNALNHVPPPYPQPQYSYPPQLPYEYNYSSKPEFPVSAPYPHTSPYPLPPVPYQPSYPLLFPGPYYPPPPSYPTPLDVQPQHQQPYYM